jgi:hypothetical protein
MTLCSLPGQLKRLARKGARVCLGVDCPMESDPVLPVVASVAATSSADEPTPSVQRACPTGWSPGGEVPWFFESLSEFSEVFQDPLPSGLTLSVQRSTVFLQSQIILRLSGRCTVYLC